MARKGCIGWKKEGGVQGRAAQNPPSVGGPKIGLRAGAVAGGGGKGARNRHGGGRKALGEVGEGLK